MNFLKLNRGLFLGCFTLFNLVGMEQEPPKNKKLNKKKSVQIGVPSLKFLVADYIAEQRIPLVHLPEDLVEYVNWVLINEYPYCHTELVEKNSLNYSNFNLKPSFMRASLHKDLAFKRGISLDLLNNFGMNLLMVSIQALENLGETDRSWKDQEMVELVSKTCDIQVQDVMGQNALHYAAHAGLPLVAQALIQRGVSVHQKDYQDRTPLSYVIAQKNACMIALFNHAPNRG